MEDEGVHSIPSMEDDIADLEEVDPDEMEEEEEDDEMGPEEIGTAAFTSAREYRQQRQRPSYLAKPDVLGYLNSFKTLDDNDRARLCRSVATYLQNQINTRNGLYRRRSVAFRSKGSDPDLRPIKPKKLKRTKSVRDLTAEFTASAPQ